MRDTVLIYADSDELLGEYIDESGLVDSYDVVASSDFDEVLNYLCWSHEPCRFIVSLDQFDEHGDPIGKEPERRMLLEAAEAEGVVALYPPPPPGALGQVLYQYSRVPLILELLHTLQSDIHTTALQKGFWDNYVKLQQEVHPVGFYEHVKAQEMIVKTMLIVTELAEGVEAIRHGNIPDDKLPQYDGFTVELADAIIRILDLAEHFNLPVCDAILTKMTFNKSRPRLHGKLL